jgi:tetratricopeptide (TPR) repeat protein
MALLTVVALTSAIASAQVGRYSQEDIQAHKEQLEKKRHQQAECPPSDSTGAGVSCSPYARAVQPEQPSVPAAKAKQTAAPIPASSQFPGATRIAPGLQATKSGGKVLTDVVALYQAKQYPEAIQKAESLASVSTNAYERSFAYQLAGTAAADAGDKDKALADFKLAVDSNGLDNDGHYQVMYNLAVMQYQTQHPADALATIDRLMTETTLRTPEYLGLKAGALAQLHRVAEAAPIFEQIHAADPANNQALMNAVAAYQQANEPAKANALLAAAQGAGGLKDAAQYRSLYVGYINDKQPKQALAVIDEGLAKGVIQPSPDLAKAYAVIAQDAYASGDAATAIAMYGKAAPMASDGEPALNLARVLWNEKRFDEARVAAQQALQKGVADTAEARKLAGQKGK